MTSNSNLGYWDLKSVRIEEWREDLPIVGRMIDTNGSVDFSPVLADALLTRNPSQVIASHRGAPKVFLPTWC
jgi:hypothetical protein